MKAFKKTLLSAAMLATLGLSTGANAYVVDLFSDPTDGSHFVKDTTIDATAGTTNVGVGTQVGNGRFMEYGSAASILGGYRDLYVEMTASNESVNARASILSAGSDPANSVPAQLGFSNGTGTTGIAKVQWDGQDNSADLALTGLNGAKLIHQDGCGVDGCDRFVAAVMYADQGFEYKITVADMTGNIRTLVADTLYPITTGTYLSEYLFDWFNLGLGTHTEGGLTFNILGTVGEVDFDNAGAMQLELNTATSQTIAVDLQLASVTKSVPEPSALALVGLALLGAGVAGQRRKSAAKA